MDGQFFTWDMLSAMSGASLLTFFIVQYTKELADKLLKWPTDFYAVLVAYGVLLVAQLAAGANGQDWRLYVLTFANAFLVSSASAQMESKSVRPPRPKIGGVTRDTGTDR